MLNGISALCLLLGVYVKKDNLINGEEKIAIVIVPLAYIIGTAITFWANSWWIYYGQTLTAYLQEKEKNLACIAEGSSDFQTTISSLAEYGNALELWQ